jgi:hypothetical protein
MMDLDITELFGDVVTRLSAGLEILYPNGKGRTKVVKSPKLNYIFGSSQYIKDILDEYSKSLGQSEKKFPLVALFTPINEDRSDPDYFSKTKVSLIIACSSCKEWSNEERRTTSFKNILRPIYNRLFDVLLEDNRFDWDFDCIYGIEIWISYFDTPSSWLYLFYVIHYSRISIYHKWN